MKLVQIAETLDLAALNATATPQISLSQSLNLDEAYLIQNLSMDRRLHDRGEKRVGLKMGFTSKAKMEQMGVSDMIWGVLTDKMQYTLGSKISKSDFIHPRAEPEIAFLIKEDINQTVTLDNVQALVGGVAVAIEVIDSRFENFKFSLEDVVADNCSSAGFAVGEWKAPDTNINGILMSMVFDDTIVGKGNSDAILGNPWESLVAACRLAQASSVQIRKGDIILAGAATSAQFINAGETISAHADGLGSVYLDVV